MIKKLLLSALAFTALSVNAQTVDEILSKNTEAMGGSEKIGALTTVKMSGTLSANGMEIPLVITKSHRKGMRIDIEIMETSNYRMANTEKGYIFMPVMGMTEPREMEAEEYKAGVSQFDVQGQLFDYKNKGNTVEYIGTEKVEGADAYKLKVTTEAGKNSFCFINKMTNRVVQTTGRAKGPDGNETDINVLFKDYKKNADGFWFAYSISSPEGPVTFETIETNMKLDENIFKN